MNKIVVAPSILSADFADFGSAVAEIDSAGAKWLHLDVMDGSFVPNLTFGPPLIRSLRKRTKAYFDVHLMIINPERHIKEFTEAGANGITFHFEALQAGTCSKTVELLKQIKTLGPSPGISIVPETPVSVLEKVLPYTEHVLIMTVPPGYGGQELIPECLEKVKKLVKMREKAGLSFRISVDGGINEQTAGSAKEAGAEVLVVGSAFFNSPNKREIVERLEN